MSHAGPAGTACTPPVKTKENSGDQPRAGSMILQKGNPLLVILIAFAIFIALLSLPWISDRQHKPSDKPNHSAGGVFSSGQVISESQFQQFGRPGSSRPTLPTFERAQNNDVTRTTAGFVDADMPNGEQAVPVPGGSPYAFHSNLQQALIGSSRSPALAAEEMQAGSAVSPSAEGRPYTAVERSAPPPAPAVSQSSRLDPALAIPADAMGIILSGQNLPLERYNAALSPDKPPAFAGAQGHSHMDRSAPRTEREHKRHVGVFDRHQTFVMR